MTNDKGLRICKKLSYFFEEQIAIHFKLETGEFRNGYIIDLNSEKLTIVFKEFVLGTIPLLLEEIKENSIAEFTEKRK